MDAMQIVLDFVLLLALAHVAEVVEMLADLVVEMSVEVIAAQDVQQIAQGVVLVIVLVQIVEGTVMLPVEKVALEDAAALVEVVVNQAAQIVQMVVVQAVNMLVKP